MRRIRLICYLVLLISSIFIGCTNSENVIKEINTKQNEIINLLEQKKEEKLSENQLKEIESQIIKLKEELKILEEKYHK